MKTSAILLLSMLAMAAGCVTQPEQSAGCEHPLLTVVRPVECGERDHP